MTARVFHFRTISPALLMAIIGVVSAIPAAGQFQLLHPTNSVWRYQTNLLQQYAGAEWVTPDFDDSTWPEGVGLFGNEINYPYGMNTFIPGQSPVAVYYRSHFNWSGSTANLVLTGTNFVDDGSIIYLNGVEIARFNMPPEANSGTPEMLASAANPGGFPNLNSGEPVLVRLEIPLDSLTNGNSNPLVPGDNVVAVQVHQNVATSSDRVFGLSLHAGIIDPCLPDTFQPTNRTILETRSTTFVVVANCVPAPAFQWYRDVGAGEELIPGATGASYTLTNARITDSGRYYAKLTTPLGIVSSRQATLTVFHDDVPPTLVSAGLRGAQTEVFAVVSKPLCTGETTCGIDSLDPWNWEIVNADNPLDSLDIQSILLNSLTLVFILEPSSPWQPETRYIVRPTSSAGTTGVGDLSGFLMPATASATTLAVPSAISVKAATGSPLYTFDESPHQFEFSTFVWPGGSEDIYDAVSMDASVQSLDAALVNQPLPSSTVNPPGVSSVAVYASTTGNLVTRPAGVRANVLLARLRNDSGAFLSALEITYSVTNRATGTSEQLPGHHVYYSLTGTPNSWNPIPSLTGSRTSGLRSAMIDLAASPWPAGSPLYLLLADDNSLDADDIFEIDNFKAHVLAVDYTPVITTQPISVVALEGAVVQFSIIAIGNPPLSYQWFKGSTPLLDGGVFSGANTPRLTITGAHCGHAGTYHCRVSNGLPPDANSAVALLTISPDIVRPRLTGAIGPNPTTVVLTFSKIVGANAGDPARYEFTDGTTISAAIHSGTVVTLTTSPRPAGMARLTITGILDNSACGSLNILDPNPTVVELTTVQVIDTWSAAWSYNTNNLDTVLDWKTTGGAGWLIGDGLFGTETSPAATNAFPVPIATPILPPYISGQLTTYFRKTVTLPPLSTGQSYAIGYYADDGAVFHLDGIEFARFNMPSGFVDHATPATTAATEGNLLSIPFSAAPGIHTLAVELHQSAPNSSDAVFGAQIFIAPTATPSLSIRPGGTNAILTWTADSSWRLRSSTTPAGPYSEIQTLPFRHHAVPLLPQQQYFRLHYLPQP